MTRTEEACRDFAQVMWYVLCLFVIVAMCGCGEAARMPVPETKAEATARYVKARAKVIAQVRKCPCGLVECGDAREAAFLAAERNAKLKARAEKEAQEGALMEFKWNHPIRYTILTWPGLTLPQAAYFVLLMLAVGALYYYGRRKRNEGGRR